jgi:hypothetical protein
MAWTISDLENLIRDEVEEHLELEYKRAAALGKADKVKDEISKDVSALANSAGGTLIYGIAEGTNSRKHLPETIDWVTDSAITKEWLENIITSRIQPRIPGLQISAVRSETGSVFVVEVPQSMTVHQASDKRYYKRHNFSSDPMEDYEIRDVMNRAAQPVIEVIPYIKKRTIYVGGSRRRPFDLDWNPTSEFVPSTPESCNEIFFLLVNNGRIKASQVLVEASFPSGVLHSERAATFSLRNTTREVIDYTSTHLGNIPKYGPSSYVPVFPKGDFECDNNFRLANDLGPIADEALRFTIFADNAQPRETTFLVRDIQVFDDSEKV